MMRLSLLLRSGLIAMLLLAVALPVGAAGPLPPGSLFRAAPTPTPAPLKFVPVPSPTVEVIAPAAPDPGESDSTSVIFFPWVGSRTPGRTTAEAMTGPQPELAATTPQAAFHVGDDSWASSFVYEVRPGDSLNDLAIEFGRDISSMSCVVAEDGTKVNSLMAGQRIVVPALADRCHQVKAGETLAEIADWYGISESSLSGEVAVKAGQFLLIPNAGSRYRDPSEVNAPRQANDGWAYGDGSFIWPVPRSQVWVSQGFRHGKHMALDMATHDGTKVIAADTGRILKAGWSEIGYGYRIVIDHGNDYLTLYAHLGEYYVRPGEVVQKGDVIGAVGSTGNSTGPHLHFEIRDYGYLIDPLLVLP